MAAKNSALKYLKRIKIGEKGQLTIPKAFREELGLATGSPFAVLRLGDGLILLPQQKKFSGLCERIGSALQNVGVTPAGALATLPEVREQVFARHYPSEAMKKTKSRKSSRSPQ